MAVIDMSRAVAFAPRSTVLEPVGPLSYEGGRVAAFSAFTKRPRHQLAPISVAQGTGLSAAGVFTGTANAPTTDGSPPREAPV